MSESADRRKEDFCTGFRRELPFAADRFYVDEPMSAHSTFKVGGSADCLFSAASAHELITVIRTARQCGMPVTVLGNGSNILVSDKGIRGIVLKIGKHMSAVSAEGDSLSADAGALLSSVSKFAASMTLAGMEFASGIPGTVGGAVYMNAGAYDGCMADIVVSSTGLFTDTLETFELKDAKSHLFGYRKSYFSDNSAVVLSSVLKLRKGDPAEISAKMNDFSGRRISSQPLELPSAGSTFKRPEGFFAGKLIEEAGLKGCRIGGACVSLKHAGFIVNDDNASAGDILALIDHVRDEVFRKTGVVLEPEVRILGEW